MPTIYSTLSNSRSFPKYKPGEKTGKVSRRRYSSSILIKGGANVADKHFQTRGFVETTVTEQDMAILKENKSFQRLQKRGFLSTQKPKEKNRDKAAPKTEEELKAKAGKKGVDVHLNTEKPEE